MFPIPKVEPLELLQWKFSDTITFL